MPVSVVVGGQFGSEGKGKTTLELVRRAKENHVVVVRVGGSNSGHTGYTQKGKKYALRQLPAGCIDRNVDVVFPAGSYIDVDILLSEIALLDYPTERIFISPYARIITRQHKEWEARSELGAAIGSTGSGVGAAVLASVARGSTNLQLESIDAQHSEPLTKFIADTTEFLRNWLVNGSRVIIEGSQGFGLSLLDGGFWPKATSRNTTASAAVMEAGLSPLDVDRIYLVLRSYPIRVAGDSGPLHNEITWEEVAKASGIERDLSEFTTVTKKLRRVGVFDSSLVKKAIRANNPTHIIMNHLDYIGSVEDIRDLSSSVSNFIRQVETSINRELDGLGFSEFGYISRSRVIA